MGSPKRTRRKGWGRDTVWAEFLVSAEASRSASAGTRQSSALVAVSVVELAYYWQTAPRGCAPTLALSLSLGRDGLPVQ